MLVSGRLVHANSGEPIPGAYVMSLAVRAWAEDTELIERYRSWNKELAASREDARDSGGWLLAGSLNASATTRADGTFVLVLAVPCSTSYSGCLGIQHRSGFEARDGAEILRVEVPGALPVNVDIPSGTWEEDVAEEGLAARWTWGDVRVP